jgi:hypothetical protein
MPETNVVKGSIEDILEQIYQRLETQYEYSDKDKHLNTLQEVMIRLTKLKPSFPSLG